MAKLIYPAVTSLDAYIADEPGTSIGAVPDELLHAFINDLEHPIGMYPLWTQNVRDYDGFGNARCQSRPDTSYAGLRADLASG